MGCPRVTPRDSERELVFDRDFGDDDHHVAHVLSISMSDFPRMRRRSSEPPSSRSRASSSTPHWYASQPIMYPRGAGPLTMEIVTSLGIQTDTGRTTDNSGRQQRLLRRACPIAFARLCGSLIMQAWAQHHLRASAELVESPHVHRQNAVVSHWHFPVVSPHRAGTVTPFVWHVIQCPLVVFDAADAVFAM